MLGSVQRFEDLEVWRKAHELALKIFALSEKLPRSYLYDLTSQLRRAALSVPTNLAEGCLSAHTGELLQFVNIARRSVSEVEYLLLFAFDQRVLSKETYETLRSAYQEVGRMLSGLHRSLASRTSKPNTSLRPSSASH